MTDDANDVTALLLQWRGGNRAALDALLPLVYTELRRIAHGRLRAESGGRGLQTTALVHEAYLRLIDIDRLSLANRTHFFAVAARLMRQVLVDHGRRVHARKRGGHTATVSLDSVSPAASADVVDVLTLERALEELERLDERLCRVVELRFFAGMTIQETADALNVSPVTIERDWALAKAWLYKRLSK